MYYGWELSDLEFVGHWEDRGEAALPLPLVARSRIPLLGDYQHAKRRALAELRERVDGRFFEMLDTLARPDIRIVVHGWDGQEPVNPAGSIRLLGVREGERGYLVKQLPGETPYHAAGFRIIECAATALADLVVAELPKADAGMWPDTVVQAGGDDGDIDHFYGRSSVHDDFDEIERKSVAFLRTPMSVAMTIDIIQGTSIFGPRGITGHLLAVRDHVDDGRYVIVDGANPTIAVGADAKRLKTMINAEIAKVVRAIKDERQ